MTLADVLVLAQWGFILFFVSITLVYLTLNLISLVTMSRYMQWRDMHALPKVFTDSEIPVSILMPAYNERTTIINSIQSLLQLSYPSYEIIVINDGSSDQTLDILKDFFKLALIPETQLGTLQTKTIRATYRSRTHLNLRVIDKDNGGKADALNAGLNYARFPLYCCIDADSILEKNCLQRVVEPFLEDETTIASGGTVRITNGCQVSNGNLEKVHLPRNILARFQIVEYLRAFLFGRMGWSTLKAMLIISGAFGLFRKAVVIEAGGYRTDTVGEDMELVVRLHRIMRLNKKPYRICFVPDPICWTEAPEDMKTLKSQRMRWQRGLSESLTMNLPLLFHRRGGIVGWVAYPVMIVFEWLEPVAQVIGISLTIVCFSLGLISGQAFLAFFVVAIGLGILLSTNALLLEEISFHLYPKTRHSLILYLAAIAENFGYRQLNAYWRFLGLVRWAFGSKGKWGEMQRKGSWQSNKADKNNEEASLKAVEQ